MGSIIRTFAQDGWFTRSITTYGPDRRNLVEIHRLLCGKGPDWRPRQLFDMFDPEAPAPEEIAQLADALLEVLEYLDELGEGL